MFFFFCFLALIIPPVLSGIRRSLHNAPTIQAMEHKIHKPPSGQRYMILRLILIFSCSSNQIDIFQCYRLFNGQLFLFIILPLLLNKETQRGDMLLKNIVIHTAEASYKLQSIFKCTFAQNNALWILSPITYTKDAFKGDLLTASMYE